MFRFNLSNLRFQFSSKKIEKEYTSVKAAITKSFFKAIIWLVIVLLAIYCIAAYIAQTADRAIYLTVGLIISILILVYGSRFERYVDFGLVAVSFALAVNTNISVHNSIRFNRDIAFFYSGYGLAALERIVVHEVTRIELKILYSLASFTVRMALVTPTAFSTVLLQIIYLVMFLYVDIRRERNDRQIFKSFHDYREELLKFKNLMVSGLPTNILILNKSLKRRLFANEYFSSTFHIDVANYRWQAFDWLKSFTVEKDFLTDVNNESSIDTTNSLDMHQFLNMLREKLLLTNHGQQFNARTRILGGEEDKIFATKVFSLLWEGKEAVAIILNDITQQHTNLSLKIADANKDKMIAMVSHELRTPLNGILGMIQIMEKQVVDEQMSTYLTVCKNSGELLLNIINSILDLGQIRNNQLKLTILDIDLRKMLEEIYYLFEFQFQQKNISLEIDVAPTVPDSLTTDKNRLKQVLINLIGNAFKFTFTGGVKISVDIDQEKPDFLKFNVTDTGIGIKEKDKRKLFKMYGRVEQNDRKINPQGVGLGLAISDQLIKMLSGNEEDATIKVESQYKKGTTLSFLIRRVLEQQMVPRPDAKSKLTFGATTELQKEKKLEEFDSSILSEEMDDMIKNLSSHVLDPRASRSSRAYNDADTWLQSKDEPGTVFSQIFKSSKTDAKAHLLRSTSARTNTNDGEDDIFLKKGPIKAHVLLVDDSPFNILVAKKLIENLGYGVETALNGQIAIEMVKKATRNGKSFNIIFMDCQMPVMDGYEATKVLREMMRKQEIAEIPIVALSANDSEDDKKRCNDVGMSDHLSKPVNETRLRKILEKLDS